MSRKEELIQIVCKDGTGNEVMLLPLIEQTIFIEKKLSELEELPFYKVNPANPLQQKVLPAFKCYKELLQQYTNVVKTLSHAMGQAENDEESPLRKWVNARVKEGG